MDEGEAALVPPITKAHFSFQGKVFVITGGSQGLGKVSPQNSLRIDTQFMYV